MKHDLPEENDAAWELLKVLPHDKEPDPAFTARVVREIRSIPQHRSLKERFSDWIQEIITSIERPWIYATATVVLLIVVGLGFNHWHHTDALENDSDWVAVISTEPVGTVESKPMEEIASDFQHLEMMDKLLASNDAAGLADEDLEALLF